MDRSQKVILTNMCMIYDNKGNVLMQDRVDADYRGITFPGGHIEKNESFANSVIREIYEETGLTIENPILCGIKQFKPTNADRYVVFLYKTNKFSGNIISSDEGEILWVKRSELLNMKLTDSVNDFKELLRIFESDTVSEFYYYIDLENNWHHQLL